MQSLFLKHSAAGFSLAAFVFILKRNTSKIAIIIPAFESLQRVCLKHILQTYEKDDTTPSNIFLIFSLIKNQETPEACNPQLNKETAFLKLVFPYCFRTLILVISVIQFFRTVFQTIFSQLMSF